MFRYVAAIWDASCAEQRATVELIDKQLRRDAIPWHQALSADGLRVYCTGLNGRSLDVYPLAGDSGVALGTVFTSVKAGNGAVRRAIFGAQETQRVVVSEGRELLASYWGRYVAFVRVPETRAVMVLRSATGEIDCLTTTVNAVRLCFSGVGHCPVLGPEHGAIDWEYVAAQVCTLMPETRRTGLARIERICHGECAVVRDSHLELRRYWDPLAYATDAAVDEPEQAAELLRSTTRACVHAWASCYDSVLCALSGGLDSSIVAAMLGTAPSKPHLVCVNYRNGYDAVSDERIYARLTADHVGCSMVEHDTPAFSLERLLALPRRAEPVWNVFDVGRADFERELAREHAAGSYILGHGGDQIFFQNGANYICPDFIHDHGPTPRLLGVALDAARMEGRALWPTLVKGLRDGFRSDSAEQVVRGFRYSALCPREVVEAVRGQRLFLPAPLADGRRIPPGKWWQVFGLSLGDDVYTCCAQESDPEYVSPLLSQPIQELCLRIPTYVLTLDATDRGLARRAFASDVPSRILRRRAKAFVGDYAKAIVNVNKRLLMQLLLDGLLVRERLLDRTMVEKVFLGDGLVTGLTSPAAIMGLAATETWLRDWVH